MNIEPIPRYSIRAATLDDSAEIARLAGELGYPTLADEISTRLKSLLKQPNHFIVVAAADGKKQLLGWIAGEERTLLVATSQIEIVGLVVGHEARRLGVGQALIGALERWANETRGKGYVVVRSNVVRAESHPFYERLGYHRNKSQHVYLKELEAEPSAVLASETISRRPNPA